ncbi:MAG TPA: 4-alpha-glucanotransferase [Vicinamibacteria bacterium]|nr:4-alpha-glucanotransferase [Vicinamibacteria bacterium]
MAPRSSGLLLHPTSLPGPWGIGDLGPQARAFVEFLAGAKQSIWQVLPLGPTGYGDSPYQCFSAFAGNPLLVSPDDLVERGLLTRADLAQAPAFPEGRVDFEAVQAFKLPLLERALHAFEAEADAAARETFAVFCARAAHWLDDFALFMALKAENGGRPWHRWPHELAVREPKALEAARTRLERRIAGLRFVQYLFFDQWRALHGLCRDSGVRLMGDIPIFVAHDSADVWAHPELFYLAADGQPSFVAGVPPDYFSATGQLWGNPLYRWDVLARAGYSWWIERFRDTLELVDLVRLDHFRGFEAYWEVPGGATTAIAGRWVPGPGAAFFDALQAVLGPLPIVAENLGVITPEVEALRERYGFPGMAILEFAFGTDSSADSFKPHNYPRNLVVYTGTHDNDTIAGWWRAGVGDSTRTAKEVEEEQALTRLYLGTDGTEIHWVFVRAALASVADTAVVPVQDLLGLGSEARMNLPGRSGGNWRWRLEEGQLTDTLRKRLRRLTEICGRAPALKVEELA